MFAVQRTFFFCANVCSNTLFVFCLSLFLLFYDSVIIPTWEFWNFFHLSLKMNAHRWKTKTEVEKLMPIQRSFVMCTSHSKHTIYFFASFVWIGDKILCTRLFETIFFFHCKNETRSCKAVAIPKKFCYFHKSLKTNYLFLYFLCLHRRQDSLHNTFCNYFIFFLGTDNFLFSTRKQKVLLWWPVLGPNHKTKPLLLFDGLCYVLLLCVS